MKRDLRGVDPDEHHEVIQYHQNDDDDDVDQNIISNLRRGKKNTKMAPLISASIDANHAAIRYNLKQINFDNSKRILDNNLLQKITDNQEFLKTAKKEKLSVRDRDVEFLKGQIHNLTRRRNSGSNILCKPLSVEIDPSMRFSDFISLLEKVRKQIASSVLPPPHINKTRTIDLFDVARTVQGQQGLGKGLKNQAENAYNILKDTTHFPPRYGFLNDMNHPDRRRYDMVLTRALRRWHIDGKPAAPRAVSAPDKNRQMFSFSTANAKQTRTKKQLELDKAGSSMTSKKEWYEVEVDVNTDSPAVIEITPPQPTVRSVSAEIPATTRSVGKITFKKHSTGIGSAAAKVESSYYDLMNQQLAERPHQPPILAAVASETTIVAPPPPRRERAPPIAAGVVWHRRVMNIFDPVPMSAPEDSSRKKLISDHKVQGLMSVSESLSFIKDLLLPIGFLSFLVSIISNFYFSNNNAKSFNYFINHAFIGPAVEEVYKSNFSRSLVIGGIESISNNNFNNLIKHTLVSPVFIKNTLIRIIIHSVHNIIMLVIHHYRLGRRGGADVDDFSTWIARLVDGEVEPIVAVQEDDGVGQVPDIRFKHDPNPTAVAKVDSTTASNSTTESEDDEDTTSVASSRTPPESLCSDHEWTVPSDLVSSGSKLASSPTYCNQYSAEYTLRVSKMPFSLDITTRRITFEDNRSRLNGSGVVLSDRYNQSLVSLLKQTITRRIKRDPTAASDVEFHHLTRWIEFINNNQITKKIMDLITSEMLLIEEMDSTSDKLNIKQYHALYSEVRELAGLYKHKLPPSVRANVDNIMGYHSIYLGCSVRPSDVNVLVALREQLISVSPPSAQPMSVAASIGDAVWLTTMMFSPVTWVSTCWNRSFRPDGSVSFAWIFLASVASKQTLTVLQRLGERGAKPMDYFRFLSGIETVNVLANEFAAVQPALDDLRHRVRTSIVAKIFETTPIELCSIQTVVVQPIINFFKNINFKNLFLYLASAFCMFNVCNHGFFSYIDAHENNVIDNIPLAIRNDDTCAIVANVLGNRVVSNSLFGYIVTYTYDGTVSLPSDPTDIKQHFNFLFKNIFKKQINIIILDSFSTPFDLTNVATSEIRVRRQNLVASGRRYVIEVSPPSFYSAPFETQLGYCNNTPMRVLSHESAKHLSSHMVGLNQQIHSNLNPTSQIATDSALLTLLTQSASNVLNSASHDTELSASTTDTTNQRNLTPVLSSNSSASHLFTCANVSLQFLNNIPVIVAVPLCSQWLMDGIQATACTAYGVALLSSCHQLMSVSLAASSLTSTKFCPSSPQSTLLFKNKRSSTSSSNHQNPASTTVNSCKLCSVQLCFPNIVKLLDFSQNLNLMILILTREAPPGSLQRILAVFKDLMIQSKFYFYCTTIASMTASSLPNGLSRRQRFVTALSASLTSSANRPLPQETTLPLKQPTAESSQKQ